MSILVYLPAMLSGAYKSGSSGSERQGAINDRYPRSPHIAVLLEPLLPAPLAGGRAE